MALSMAYSYLGFKSQYGSALPIFRHEEGGIYAYGMSFGARLSARRKELGLTQSDLGKGLGTDGVDVGKQVVYGWEKDLHYPRVDQLILICKRLRCSSDHLLFGEEARSESARFAAARKAITQLTDQERLDLLTAIMQPGVHDHEVEEKMPATKAKPATNADEVLRRARPQEPVAAKSSKRRA